MRSQGIYCRGTNIDRSNESERKFADDIIDAVDKNENDKAKKKQAADDMTEEQLARFFG